MTLSDEKSLERQPWKVLAEAGLVEIRPDEFADRLKEVKNLVISHLRELLDSDQGSQECASAAHSLGTLRGLELKLQTNRLASGNSPKD